MLDAAARVDAHPAKRHPAEMRCVGSLVLLAVIGAGLSGCHRHAANPQEAHDNWCENNPQAVEYVPQGTKPSRPYRVVGMVDAFWFASVAGRSKTLQIKACKLNADAVIDATPDDRPTVVTETQTPTPWGTYRERTVETGEARHHPGEGIAIKYSDAPPNPPAALPVPAAPPANAASTASAPAPPPASGGASL